MQGGERGITEQIRKLGILNPLIGNQGQNLMLLDASFDSHDTFNSRASLALKKREKQAK